MKLTHTLLAPALSVAFAAAAIAQTSTTSSAPAADDLPDAPNATAAALVHPNGPTVVMETSMGRITCQFFQRQAPHAVANFIGLAEGAKEWTDPNTGKKQRNKPYYDGTIFHRVIPEFMIQGGDPTGTGMGDPGYSFDDEFDPNLNFDQPGRLAMANSGPNSNGSQFFITEQPVESLNQKYTLFGQCDASSVEVVKTIARVERDERDKPITPVVLKKVTIVREDSAAAASPASAPPASAQMPRRVNVSAGIAQGMLLHKTPIVYPIDAKQQGISGTVVLHALIDREGHIANLRVISGPEVLQQAALDSVKQWEYRPYLLNNEPVEVETNINVIFMLSN